MHIQSSQPGIASWTIVTDVFEGPLDLLLYLVKRDGVDLRALKLAAIADAYLTYLDQMRAVDLAIAAEYLVMASKLVHLKSLELLPRLPAALDEDPAEQLAQRIQDYAKYRAAADLLEARPQLERDVFEGSPEDVDEALDSPPPRMDAFALFDTFHSLLLRQSDRENGFQAPEPTPDLQAAARKLLAAVTDAVEGLDLYSYLQSFERRSDRVAVFVALLEMMRRRWMDARTENGRVSICLLVEAEALSNAQVASVISRGEEGLA